MQTFLEYTINKELSEYAFSLGDFLRMNMQLDENIPIQIVTGPKKNPVAERPKTTPPWKKVKAGSDAYFNATPAEQKQMQKDAVAKLGKNKLLGDEASNPKLAKSGKKIPEYRTKGLSLAPSTMSGIDVCPNASAECKASCLGSSAGRGVMKPIRDARIKKTHQYFDYPKEFYAKLDREITLAKKEAAKQGQKLAIRLNVLSDIPHEHVAAALFKKHPDVAFYDYTKISGRSKHKEMPANYHLTISSTGVNHAESNWKQVRQHLEKGGVAAMAFSIPSRGKASEQKLPDYVYDEETGKKYKVVDGDEHDHRHLDKLIHDIPANVGVIAGLKFKGGPKNIARAGNFAVKVDGNVVVIRKNA